MSDDLRCPLHDEIEPCAQCAEDIEMAEAFLPLALESLAIEDAEDDDDEEESQWR